MSWTKELPTKDGYYWLREDGKDPEIVQLLDNYLYQCGSEISVAMKGSGYYSVLNAYPGNVEWYGPLEVPA